MNLYNRNIKLDIRIVIILILFTLLCYKTGLENLKFKDQNESLIDLKQPQIFKLTNKSLDTKVKIHISYVHYLNSKDERTTGNFKFFFNFAYEPCHSDVDFTITLNIDNLVSKNEILNSNIFLNAFDNDKALLNRFISCSDSLNLQRNTYIIVRKNKNGGDLCANVDFFKSHFWMQNKNNYKFYFFINSSARGPFLPNYWLKKWLYF